MDVSNLLISEPIPESALTSCPCNVCGKSNVFDGLWVGCRYCGETARQILAWYRIHG